MKNQSEDKNTRRFYGSFLRIFFIVGIAAAFILGPVLQLKWFSGDLPFSPWREEKKPAAEVAGRYITAPDGSDSISWPAIARENAPELALRFAPADWFTAYGSKGLKQGDTPKVLSLTLLLPDGTALAQAPCAASEKPFAGCSGALAILEINQSSEIWRQRQLVLGTEKLEPQDSMPYAERSTRSRYSFWTKKDIADGEQVFQGWSCRTDSAAERAELALFFALPGHNEPGCFRFSKWWEKFKPAWFGYEEQPAFLECTPYAGCNSWFLFHGRLVNIKYEYLSERGAAEMRTQLMVSAWQMLNRLQRAARRGHSEIDIAELRAQQASCLAFAAEAERWQKENETRENLRYGKMAFYLKAVCQRSAQIALALVEQAPAEALPLLRGIAPALLQSQEIQGRNSELLQLLYSGQIKALTATSQGESAEMLEMLMAAMQAAGSLQQEEERQLINTLLPQALALVHRQGAVVPAATRTALFGLIDRYYGGDENYEKWHELYQTMLDDIALAYGNESQELIEPLRNLGWKNWHASDFAALKSTADRLASIMLAQPQAISGSDAASEAARKREGGAFDAIFFYRNYGFHEKRLSEAAGLMTPLLARLDKTLGPDAPLSKAARYHQQEVTTGRAGSGPIGGGFLGY